MRALTLIRFKPRLLRLVVLLATGGAALTTHAQVETRRGSDEPTIEEITITGSRIQRDDLTANSPIEFIGRDDIRINNTANMEEFLRDRPQFVAANGANTNNGNDGSATLDLRNLGEERTLVLVNGKRFTPYDYQGYVDLGMIPTSLVERVEIITGGASAVYGTDAIAGVVNFILDEDFEGIEFDVSTFSTTESDAERQDYNLTLGTNFADGRGNVVLNLGYTDQEALTQAQRDYGETTLDNLLEPVGSLTTPVGTVFDTSFPGDPEEGLVQFDPNGNTVPAFTTFNFNPFNLYQTPQKKQTATLLGRFDLTDSLSSYGRISYAKNEVDTIIAPSGTFFFPFSLNYTTNPFLGPDAVTRFSQVDAAECTEPQLNADDEVIGCITPAPTANDGFVDILFGRRLPEVGTRDSLYENETTQYVFGLEGELGESTSWDLFAQYGKTDRRQDFINDVAYARAQESMLAVDNGSGQVVCSSGNPDCVPANFFGEGNLSAEAASYIRLNLQEVNDTEQWIVGGSVTGDLGLNLPGAGSPVSYAAGFEIRRDEGRNRPDANYSGGNSIGFGSSSPVDAELEIEEVFVESLVPVLDSVNIELGLRYAQYENAALGVTNDFNNTSYKIGGDWTIAEGLRARAMYQHAVRAPTLAEIGLPITPSTGDLNNEPCEGSNPVGNPELTALCIATGVPPGSIGSVTSIVSGQVNNFVGGNPTLDPEEADTYTIGLVYAPDYIPGLEMSIDYFDISIEDVITQLAEQEVVTACYTQEMDPDGQFCSRIARNPLTGSLQGGNDTGVNVSLVNSAEERVKGWDVGINYSFDLADAGSLGLGFVGTYTAEHEFTSAPGFATTDCAGLVGNTCTRPDPQWRWTQTTSWEWEGLRMNLTWRYLQGLKQDAIALGAAPASNYAKTRIGNYSYVDLAGSYAFNDNWRLRLGVDNVFDKQSPIVGNSYGGTAENSGNTFPATYDALGRSYFLGMNVSFE